MPSQDEAPNNSMSVNNNNCKRPYDAEDDNGDDDYVANNTDATTHGREAKRQRPNEDDDASTDHAPRSLLVRDMSPSPPINPSDEETLDDVDADLDDLESISEHEMEELEESIGTADMTSEDAVVESLGLTEPATPEDMVESIVESIETDDDNNFNINNDYNDENDDYYRHIGSWSEPSSQQTVGNSLRASQPSRQPPPRQQTPRHQSQPRIAHMERMARIPYYHLPQWNQQHCGKEYFRHALSDSWDSEEEF